MGYLVKPLDAEGFLRQVRVALERGREQRNLRRALQNNQEINQALGVLMGFLHISEQQAFEAFVAHASLGNVKAVALARDILAACRIFSNSVGNCADARACKNTRETRAFLNQFRCRR